MRTMPSPRRSLGLLASTLLLVVVTTSCGPDTDPQARRDTAEPSVILGEDGEPLQYVPFSEEHPDRDGNGTNDNFESKSNLLWDQEKREFIYPGSVGLDSDGNELKPPTEPSLPEVTVLGPVDLMDEAGYSLRAAAHLGRVRFSADPTNAPPGRTVVTIRVRGGVLELTNKTPKRALTLTDAAYYPGIGIVQAYPTTWAVCRDGALTLGSYGAHCFVQIASLTSSAIPVDGGDLLHFDVGEYKRITPTDFAWIGSPDRNVEIAEAQVGRKLKELRKPSFVALSVGETMIGTWRLKKGRGVLVDGYLDTWVILP